MTWNYRVMNTGKNLGVYSVYYDDDGRITTWSVEPMTPSGQCLEELTKELERFRRALTLPVLDYETAEPRSSRPPETDA